MWIVVTGNPIYGFEFFGAFETEIDAVSWADKSFDDQDWWIASLADYRGDKE